MTHAFFKALLFLARRQRDSRHGRRAGHAQDGRPAQENPSDLLDDAHRPRWRLPASPASPDFSARTKFWKRRSGPACESSAVAARTCSPRGLTSFYMFRLIFLTFFGKQRYDEHHVHVHESPQQHDDSADHSRGAFDRRRLVRGAASSSAARITSTHFLRRCLHRVRACRREQPKQLATAGSAERVLRWSCCMR